MQMPIQTEFKCAFEGIYFHQLMLFIIPNYNLNFEKCDTLKNYAFLF